MSRKKINVFGILGLLLCYVVCLGASYKMAGKYVASDFERSMENLTKYFETEYTQQDNTGFGDKVFEMTPDNLALEFSKTADHDYPWQAAFVDSKGEIAAKTGSGIYLYSKTDGGFYISLEEYLTEEHYEQLEEFWASVEYPEYIANPLTREYVGYGIDCYVENGMLIPVKLQLVELERPEHILTLQLSDEKADYHYCGTNLLDYDPGDEELVEYYKEDGSCYIQLADESIANKSTAYVLTYFEDVENGGRNRELYQSLSEELNEANIKNNIALKLSGSQIYTMENAYWYVNYLQINGEHYTMYLTAEYSEFGEVIHSSVFVNAVAMQSILFIIIALILLLGINSLYKKNQKLEQSRQMFTSAVAHELKTPIAIIQNQCECVLEDVNPEKNKEYVRSVYDEAVRMNKMILSFLQYNRLQSMTHVEKEKCNFSEIIMAEVQKYEDLIEAAGQILEIDINENVEANVNPELIAVVAGNYLSNAYKYTDENREIKISLKKENGKVCFEVFNEGAVIDQSHEKQIWDVLGRQDEARNREKGSSGMGLPICRQILELHGAEYGCEMKDGGVEFWFRV